MWGSMTELVVEPALLPNDGISDTSSDISWAEQCAFLQDQLAQKDQDLRLAAEIGKQLLEDNNELSRQLASQRHELAHQIECLQQENYDLNRKLETKILLEKNLNDEVENLRSALSRQKEELAQTLEANHTAKVNGLKKQLCNSQNLLEKSQLTEQQLVERNKGLETMLHDVQQQVEQQMAALQDNGIEELGLLTVEVNSLKQEKMTLASELADAQNSDQQLRLEISTLHSQVARRDEELEQVQCQATSYVNALEKSREEMQELKVELDQLKMEKQDHKSKGNSLFAEVEDRRVEAEKQLIALRVQHEALQQEHEGVQKQFQNLKCQLAGMLTKYDSNADIEYLGRLQSQLHKAQSNIKSLVGRLASIEERTASKLQDLGHLQRFRQVTQQDSPTNYDEYHQGMVKTKEKETSKLQEELSTMRMCYHGEEEKVTNLERKLFESNRQLNKLRGQNLKLHLKVEEMRMKYEPDKYQSHVKKSKVISEKLPVLAKSLESQGASSSSKDNAENMPGTPKSPHRGLNARTEPMAKRPLIMARPRPGSPAIARSFKVAQQQAKVAASTGQCFGRGGVRLTGGSDSEEELEAASQCKGQGTNCDKTQQKAGNANVGTAKSIQNDCKVQ